MRFDKRHTRKIFGIGTTTLLLGSAAIAYSPNQKRYYKTVSACANIAFDYKTSLDDLSEIHLRSANKLLTLFRENGGVYVKVGQTIASLVHLLPLEYCVVMRALQDKCAVTPIDELDALLKNDINKSINELFSDFDPVPLGSASLAQVHKATLRETGKVVAVKIQHPELSIQAPKDIKICTTLVKVIEYLFPDFQFSWLSNEMQQSLPEELNFNNEANNARKIAQHLIREKNIKVPEIFISTNRILIMEYVEGVRIDDLNYMKEKGISVSKLSSLLGKMYLKMIFGEGFIHCDPHQGNVMVRHIPGILPNIWPFSMWFLNFEILLLDHGLYRQISKEFMLKYAYLWNAIIRGNEFEIERASERLFKKIPSGIVDDVVPHRLFASMISGRSWAAISTSISNIRSEEEIKTIQQNAKSKRFLKNLSMILSNVPRELLFLMRNNDILRSVDASLGTQSQTTKYNVIRMGAYCSKYIYTQSMADLEKNSDNNHFLIRWFQFGGIFVRYVKDWTWLLMLDILITFNPNLI